MKSGTCEVRLMQGANLQAAHAKAKHTANSRRKTVYIRNQLTGAVEPIEPSNQPRTP
jgi:hypothetical protein